MDIAAWLQGLGLGQYEQAFRENDVDTAVLVELTAEDLTALGVRSVGHRRKLLAAITALQAERITAPRSTGARRALAGEMKQVSVLFCDIVNSTSLAERLGAEAMRDLMHGFLETSLAEVRRYGGSAPHFTGDGFMALFGAPVAHEDHVRRALLAALAIERGDTDREGMELSLRIGVHTGPVVFGPVADNLPMDNTVIGDTANVAARLQQAAEPGTVLISEATRLLARGYVQVEPVGPLILKGKAEPIRAYRLLAVSHRRSDLDEALSFCAAAFVNRDSELATLNNFFWRVEKGHGQAVGLVGEPGIGKSRLLAEFRRQLGDGRVTWVEGRCLSYGTAIPYLLAIDLLRSNCGIFENDAPGTVVEKLYAGLREVGMDPDEDGPVLLHLLEIRDVADSPALLNPEAIKSTAFETLRQLTVKRSVRNPLVLVLEDVHWVDKVSEEFLRFLAESVPDARVLLLATYRPEYRPPWIDKPSAGQTPLQPLSQDDSLRMIHSVLQVEHLVDLATQEIVAKADGNPFFLEQLARHAGETRDLRTDLMVPNTIHDVVMARIDRLPEQTKRLLQIAAVIGREFPLRLLSVMWQGPEPIEEQLRELVRLGFVYERAETEGSVYVFRHALTQETAYGSLLERHRRVHHGAAGQALEELYGGREGEVAELLAHHFGRSNEAEKSVDYAILAGEKSQRRWANSEALTYFNDALRLLDLLPDTEANRLRRIDAVLKQGEVKYALGQYTEHVRALQDIRAVVDETADPPRQAAWHYWTGFLHATSGGRPDVAIEHCQEAAKIASASGLEEINAFAQSCLAQVYVVAGRLHEAIEAGEHALTSFEARGDLWWAVRTLWILSIAANALGQWRASVNYCRRGLDHGIALNEDRFKSVQAVAWWRMGSTFIQQGELERGLQCCNEALALGPIQRDVVMAKAACAYAEAGGVGAGIAALEEALLWFDQSGLRYTHLFYLLWCAEGHIRRGDRFAARPLIDNVLEISRKTGYLQLEGRACWLMGECLSVEALASSENYIEAAICLLERMGAQNDFARALVSRAALRQRAGDIETAHRSLNRAHLIFQKLDTRDEPARVDAALAALDRGLPIPFLSGET